jgi:uncharacterized protein YndB with AHSA1/START domain
MTQCSVTHATFTIERTYDAAPAKVFRAWSEPEAKRSWCFCHPDWPLAEFTMDFRPGGCEVVKTGPAGGTVHAYEARYFDIIPNERIVYGYAMHLDDARISVSLVTVQFLPSGTGTRMVFTEQGAYLDGLATPADREHGTKLGMDNLEPALARL